ncbi:uncharacterized protein LOC110709207 [Chenopodium quinoa]|uniref:uncharacterized protein LOC110709207 n=1 Tax=Chenopodium quinoa TaxID=63459 RepID=UPI000B78610E|nr:uncharacterized protein LOC110709207 [Chenopodium quinoa]
MGSFCLYYIKDRNWWDCVPSKGSGWASKSICKVKDEMKEGFELKHWAETGYSIRDGYGWLQGDQPAVRWTHWIWNKFNVPKHSFIAWLAIHDILRLRKRLCRLGICTEETCLLCGSEPETLQHLFFSCRYSKTCMTNICNWIGLNVRVCDIESAWKDWTRGIKDQVKRNFVLAALTALLYHIWLIRNYSYWQKAVIHPGKLYKVIRLEALLSVS